MNVLDLAVRQFKDLPLALIDRPELDARIERTPEFLGRLCLSINRYGVLVPLIVVAVGDRYELVDGFTRYIACQRLGVVTVPCTVYPSKSLALEGVKFDATQVHENFTPADEAIYFNQLYNHECGQDIEKVAALVNKNVSYVDARLRLVQGDELVFVAVKDKKIKLGVAEELNKIKDDGWRHYYLEHAVISGATVSVVSGWVVQHKINYETEHPAPPAPNDPSPSVAPAPTYDPMLCRVCGKSDHRMTEHVHVHHSCREAILDPLLATYRGEA